MKMILMLGILFILSIQPMMVISSLIFVILLYSMKMLWEVSSFWFSYMVILVLMSGVLVVFTYMMSILPNESFELSSLIIIVMSMAFFCNYSGNSEFLFNSSLSSMKIWGGVTYLINLLLVLYLLAMMIMIVWISMMEKGAIRIG